MALQILNATLAQHLESYIREKGNIKMIKEIKETVFVDNLICARSNEEEELLINKKAEFLLMEDSLTQMIF